MEISICSTLSGKVALKHPVRNVLVREDVAVFRRKARKNNEYWWTHGSNMKSGYMCTSFRDGKRSVPVTIHRMVAECFIPNPENKYSVDHINRIRHDNRVQNLRWADMHEQLLNTSRHYEAVQKWGFTPIHDHKTYNRVREQVRIAEKYAQGKKYILWPDGHYHWARHYSFDTPLNCWLICYRLVETSEMKKQRQKEEKREYDKAYRALKGEERLRQKREYYYAHRQEILDRQKASRKRRRDTASSV